MSKRSAILACLLGVSIASVGVRANDSHDPLSKSRPARDLAQQLQAQLGQALPPKPPDENTLKRLQELMKNQDPEELRKWLDQNPELARWFQQQRADNPDFRNIVDQKLSGQFDPNDPASANRLRELIEGIKSRGSSPGPTTNAPNAGMPSATPAPGSTAPGTTTPPGTTRPPGTMPSIKTPSEDRLRNFARNLDRWAPKGSRDDPAVQRFFNDLGKSDFSKSADQRFQNGPKVNWDRVGDSFKGTGKLFDRTIGKVDGSRIGDPSRLNAPRMPDAPTLPSMGAPGGPSLGGFEMSATATMIFMLVALALGAFLLWRYLLRPLQQQKAKNPNEALGPWPVDPALVKTRAELVQAFDYLALLQCGKPAKVWHHRELANRLGAEDHQRRASATTLADVYEHARYAPNSDDLPIDQIDRARRELCFLAGVTAP